MSDYLCNLIIPGAAKSGTSSLHSLLGCHPDICMSQPKEPQFFSFKNLYKDGPDHHNQIFEHVNGEAVAYGESSQSYLVHEESIRRIQASLRAPKIIILLRHPLQRLLSHYRWRYKLTVETRSLDTALSESGLDTEYYYDRKSDIYRANGGYIAFSQYSQYVPKWIDAFGSDRVLLLRTDDLKNRQQDLAKVCFRFLGLSPTPIANVVRRHKTSSTTPLPRSLPWFVRATEWLTPNRLQKTQAFRYIRSRVAHALTPDTDDDIPEAIESRLRERLAPDIEFYKNVDRV